MSGTGRPAASSDEAVRLDASQRGRAAALLARAFQDDPLFRALLPHAARRPRVSEWLHDRVLRYCLVYGVAHTSPALEGVACWLPPGRTELSVWGLARSGLLALPLRMGPTALARFRAYLSCSSRVRRQEAPARHWYLWALGVDPPYQGKGVGGRLLRPVLDQADASGTACYLETENATNLAFYERHGFRVVSEEKVPGLGLSTWSMIRDPARNRSVPGNGLASTRSSAPRGGPRSLPSRQAPREPLQKSPEGW